MTSQPGHGPAAARRSKVRPPEAVAALDAARIERALSRRTRYRYVQPRVQAQSPQPGWIIVSPNCSRNIDPNGGDIDIAWFEPIEDRPPVQWRLHRRDHAQACWVPTAEGLTLSQALALVCSDSLGIYWP